MDYKLSMHALNYCKHVKLFLKINMSSGVMNSLMQRQNMWRILVHWVYMGMRAVLDWVYMIDFLKT